MANSKTKLTTPMPLNTHLHLREEARMIKLVAPYTAQVFCGAVIMGNLRNRPIIRAQDAFWYRDNRLMQHLPTDFTFIIPLMLTQDTTPQDIDEACESGIQNVKLLPHFSKIELPALLSNRRHLENLKTMEKNKMASLWHIELIRDPKTGHIIEPVKREASGMVYLRRIMDKFPDLPIVVEHVSTWQLAKLVKEAPPHVAATVTPQHLTLDYYDVFDKQGKIINPHHYCNPVAKFARDRNLLIKIVTSADNDKFMLGDDSAPQDIKAKQGPNPAAGIFHTATIPVIVDVFEKAGKLGRPDILVKFIYQNAARRYGFPETSKQITLVKKPWQVPKEIRSKDGIRLKPFMAGETLDWQIEISEKSRR